MTIGNLAYLLEQLDQDAQLVIEITKAGEDAVTTYDISFGCSEFGDFMLKVHE